eukprot:30567-Eustigmatos_ZCMA.PRE.1
MYGAGASCVPLPTVAQAPLCGCVHVCMYINTAPCACAWRRGAAHAGGDQAHPPQVRHHRESRLSPNIADSMLSVHQGHPLICKA